MQRFFDVIFSFFAIIFFSPILFSVSLILRFTGEGEIIYRQERIGADGKIFGLFKFATMLKNSPNIGSGNLTLENDSRVLPVGKFLRKSKLNELPQLFNIFFGDMSVIGPRPMVPSTFEKYPFSGREKIKSVRPGLSGIGSIIFRDEEKFLGNHDNPTELYEKIIIPYKSELECWFIDRYSIFLYFKIIFLTIFIVLKPSSKAVKYAFKDLPLPPNELKL